MYDRIVMLSTILGAFAGSPMHRSASAQAKPVVSGVVTDSTGAPISFAQVRGPGIDPRASDDSGYFRFTMRKAGPLSLEVRRVGFQPLEVKFSIGNDTTLELVMNPIATSLKTVRIDAEATVRSLEFRGFYDRLRDRAKGTNTGYFIMPEEIEARRGALKPTQLLQGIPNLRILKIRGGTGWLDTVVGPGGCPMMVYIDGQRLNRLGGGVQTPVEFDHLITTRDLAGVEVYTRANAPPQFQQFALNCGVVLFWTK